VKEKGAERKKRKMGKFMMFMKFYFQRYRSIIFDEKILTKFKKGEEVREKGTASTTIRMC